MARSDKSEKLKRVGDKDLKDVSGGGRDQSGQHTPPRRSEASLEFGPTGEDVTLSPDGIVSHAGQ